MTTLAAPPAGTSPGPDSGRLGPALLFSIILHAILILGIGFHFARPALHLPTVEVTLVNTSNAEKPVKADFLAQADNAGGGNSKAAHRPGALFSGPLPVPQAGIAPVPLMPAAAPERAASGPHVLTTTGRMTTRVPPQHDATAAPRPEQPVGAIPTPEQLQMARLAQEVRDEQQAYAEMPRRRYVSANTRHVADAAYQVAWVHRIERVGNLNYPDAARRRHLHGDVVLSVTIGRDGKVRGVTVNASSGYPILDDAAVRIVHLAAPFPPIPRDHDADGHRIDELVITRTWRFLPGEHLVTRGVGAE